MKSHMQKMEDCPKCGDDIISGPHYRTSRPLTNSDAVIFGECLSYICKTCGYIEYTACKDAP